MNDLGRVDNMAQGSETLTSERRGASWTMAEKLVTSFPFAALAYVLVSLLLLWPMLALPGYVFYGDTLLYRWDFGQWWLSTHYAWWNGPSTAYLWTLQGLSWPSFSTVLGDEWASKLGIFFLAPLPGISAFLASRLLLRSWASVGKRAKSFLPLLAGFIYELSFYNPGLLPNISFAWPYIALPLFVALVATGLETTSWKSALLLALVSTLGSVNPLWILSFAFAAGPFILLRILHAPSLAHRLRQFRWLLLAAVLISLLNAFWIIPTYFGYSLGASGFFQRYTGQNLISYPSLLFFSRWSLLDYVVTGHSAYTFFYSYPRNWTIGNVLLPVLAYGILVTKHRRNPDVLCLSCAALIGTFFAKGVQPPLGGVYYGLATALPYGAGAVMRNVGWGAWAMMFAYSVLAPLTFVVIYERLTVDKAKAAQSRVPRWTRGRPSLIPGLLAALIVLALVSGTVVDMAVYTYPHFSPVQIPYQYGQMNSELAGSSTRGKVLWVPDTGEYPWHGWDPLTLWPTTISALPPSPASDSLNLSPWLPSSEITVPTTRLGEILSLTNTKYVVFHGDSVYPNQMVLRWLDNQTDLSPQLRIPYVVGSPAAWAEPEEQSGYEVNNVPFLALSNTPLKRGGSTSVVVKYTIPANVLNDTGSGVFGVSFGIALEVLPVGVQPPMAEIGTQRLAESFASNQTQISADSGFTSFKVTLPEVTLAGAADLYAWYYGSSFRQLTPLYFVGRLAIWPPEYQSEFVLYENTEVTTPLFVPGQALVMYGGLREMLLATQLEAFNLRDWGIILARAVEPQLVAPPESMVVTDGLASPPNQTHAANQVVLSDPVHLLGSLALVTADENATLPRTLSGYVINDTVLEAGPSSALTRAGTNLVSLRYIIPQAVLNASGTGRFWAGFGLAFEVLPAGLQPSPDQMGELRIGESFWQNQTMLTNTTGTVNFTIPVPASFNGSSVDVYGRYYGGPFRALSPYYFVGRWSVSGAYRSTSYGFDLALGQTLRLINQSVSIRINVPASGDYELALKLKGTASFQIGSKTFMVTGDGSWVAAAGLYDITAGKTEVLMDTPDVAYIGTLLLFENRRNVTSVNTILKPTESPASILSYSQLSPTDWVATINASRPFFLAFTEPYDGLWELYVGKESIRSQLLYGIINGFWIDSTGLLQIRIHYMLQGYLDAGLVISLSSAAMATTVIFVRQTRYWKTRGKSRRGQETDLE